mmetsp:Transcript_759/g.1466  ORF Transcript_759/g.1466 Transcript_759/m.1466 type:complete len:84 (+) Transcript_759:421-672(+)
MAGGGKQGSTVLIMSSFFFTKLWQGKDTGNFEGVWKWTEKWDLGNVELLVVPINIDNVHLILIVLSKLDNCIRWCDSLQGVEW